MDMFDRFINLGFGIFSITRERAQAYIDEMVERGEIKREDAKETLDEVIQKGQEQRQEMSNLVQDEIDKWRSKFGVVTRAEYDELLAKVRELEKKQAPEPPTE